MPNQDYTESTQDLAVKTAGARSHQPHLELGPVVPERRMGRPEPEKRALHERLTRASCAHHRHLAG